MKKMIGGGILILLFSVLSFGLYWYSLTWTFDWSVRNKDPIEFVMGFFDEIQGKTMFQRKMNLVEKKSFLPYVTKYNIFWNGMTVGSGDKILARNVWVEVALWNAYGVAKAEVRGVDTKKLFYPAKNPKSTSVSVKKITAQVSQDLKDPSQNQKYLILYLEPPRKDKELHIVITDTFGNITETTVAVSSIIKF